MKYRLEHINICCYRVNTNKQCKEKFEIDPSVFISPHSTDMSVNFETG